MTLRDEIEEREPPPICFTIGARWFVVYTGIRCEQRARLGIEALGFETFAPLLRKPGNARRYSRKQRLAGAAIVERPLFSRYVFVRFDPSRDEWYPINSTHGVETLLTNNDVPMRIPDAVVKHWRDAEAAGMFDLTKPRELRVPFTKGDHVRVNGASLLNGHDAEVLIVLPGRQRVQVLLDNLMKVELPWSDVQRKEAAGTGAV